MAAANRFVNDEEVNEFSENPENENTNQRTLYNLKVFKEFTDNCDEKREIENIQSTPAKQKNSFRLLCERKILKNTNTRPLERSYSKHQPATSKDNYGFSLLNDKEFYRVQDAVEIHLQMKPAQCSRPAVR